MCLDRQKRSSHALIHHMSLMKRLIASKTRLLALLDLLLPLLQWLRTALEQGREHHRSAQMERK